MAQQRDDEAVSVPAINRLRHLRASTGTSVCQTDSPTQKQSHQSIRQSIDPSVETDEALSVQSTTDCSERPTISAKSQVRRQYNSEYRPSLSNILGSLHLCVQVLKSLKHSGGRTINTIRLRQFQVQSSLSMHTARSVTPRPPLSMLSFLMRQLNARNHQIQCRIPQPLVLRNK